MFDVVCLASWNADLTSRVARPPARGETLLGHRFTIGPGGKGSNAAIACARQGARVAVIARIGADDFGRMALALWSKESIDARHVEVADGEPSGVAQILVYDDGDNSIVVAPGAGAGLGEAQVVAAVDTIRSAKVVMASCEVPMVATTEAFRLARAAGVTTLLNPAPAMPLPDELLALTDLLTPNETELRALAGIGAAEPLSVAAQALMRRGAGAVIVTLGERGCELHRATHPELALPGHRVTVGDTIGAGDTFTGALAAALARAQTELQRDSRDDTRHIEHALAWANAAAALSVTGQGAIGAMPSREATAQRLS